MPRRARLDVPGTLHHVIVRGIERRDIVDDHRDRDDFVSRVGRLSLETNTTIYAWALMTNHAHLLLRSGPVGLPGYMRRLLSGYATYYNRRHRRHGHLFQNRYKSIVCEENSYFKELIRYIHLNPLRVALVESLVALDGYRWCGHSVLMGRSKNDWQDRDYVLRFFGTIEGEAKKNYREFVKEGIEEGRRSDLVGGGLIRSQGGWSAVKEMRRKGIREKSDERILGSGDFVDQLIFESDKIRRKEFFVLERSREVEKIMKKVCDDAGINMKELVSGNRRRQVAAVRRSLAQKLVEEIGLSLAETGRKLGVSPSAIAKIFSRRANNKS